jgi:hypothetical protein
MKFGFSYKLFFHKKNVFVFLLTHTIGGYAQQDRLDTFFVRSAQVPIETVYLHCDKYSALAGDTIWWSAYVFENNLPSTVSTNLHVELFSKGGRPILKELFPIFNSLSIGQLAIPDSLKPGVYWIRAYTKYQLNFDSVNLFEAPVSILNGKVNSVLTTKTKIDPGRGPFVTNADSLLLITTKTDTGLACLVYADQSSDLLDKQLDLILASDHQPVLRAHLSLSAMKPWQELAFGTRNAYGVADLLLFSGDRLIARQSIFLGRSSSPEVRIERDTSNGSPDGNHCWSIHIMDSGEYNCSVSVTDADRTVSPPLNILQWSTPDPFDYQAALKGRFPIVYFEDTSFLTWCGMAKTDKGKPVKNGDLIVLMSNDSSAAGKPRIVPIDEKGRFALANNFFFDSTWMTFQLNSFQDDPSAKKVQLIFDRFSPPGFVLSGTSHWKDTIISSGIGFSDYPPTGIAPGAKVKELPSVTVRGNALKELDEHYATGLFTEPTPYAFDLRTDKTVTGIWTYLRKNLPGFQGGSDIGMMPNFNGQHIVFYVDGQVKTVAQVDDYWYDELAYVKAYNSIWLDQTAYTKRIAGDYGFILVPTPSGGLKIPVDDDVAAICIYTRKGKDIRTGWRSLPHVRLGGYAPISRWTAFSSDPCTLYWDPVQRGNDFTIRFYNRSAKRYRICIEGVSREGKVVHYQTIIPAP